MRCISNIKKIFINFMFDKNLNHFISVAWIMLCSIYLIFQITQLQVQASLGDIGAYFSGVFSPIALYWFYLSFKTQREELSLQRQELKLQRQALETQVEELKNSVKAQQGSETALTQQSNILSRQLTIVERNSERADAQFQIYLDEMASKKPVFRLNKFNEVKFLHTPERDEKPFYFQCRIPIINLQAKASITLIEVTHPLVEENTKPTYSGKLWIICELLESNILEITSNLKINDLSRLQSGEFDDDKYELTSAEISFSREERLALTMCEEYLLECQLKIYYSSDSGMSGSDIYEFRKTNGRFVMVKVMSNTFTIRYERETHL